MQLWQLKPASDLQQQPLERYRYYHRESGLVSTVARFCWWSMIKSSMHVLHRVEYRGREQIPLQPPFVLVANHASHLDALVLGSCLPLALRDRLFPLAAGDVFFETPAIAAFSATVLNALPVWRKNCGAHAIKDLRERLIHEPTVYILFPEGGRSRDGHMLPFKPGIGMMVAQTSIPVIPCHLEGTFAAFPPDSRLPRPRKIRVRIGTPRTFAETANRRDGWNEIAHCLEQDILALARSAEANGAVSKQS
jgi:1-acyl-sn-glycerol-3-phosphate acyltransferase